MPSQPLYSPFIKLLSLKPGGLELRLSVARWEDLLQLRGCPLIHLPRLSKASVADIAKPKALLTVPSFRVSIPAQILGISATTAVNSWARKIDGLEELVPFFFEWIALRLTSGLQTSTDALPNHRQPPGASISESSVVQLHLGQATYGLQHASRNVCPEPPTRSILPLLIAVALACVRILCVCMWCVVYVCVCVGAAHALI